MPGSIQERLNCLLQAFVMPAEIKPPMVECLLRPFEWYGFARAHIRSRLEIVQSNPSSILYNWNGYKVWWPKVADAERLVTIIGELFVKSNPHYFIPSHLQPWMAGKIIIDVGSCEGLFALKVLREFQAKQVIAIEPGCFMANLLKETFRANMFDERVKVVQCLAGKERGSAAFQECLSNPALASIEKLNEKNTESRVEIIPLDDVVKELNMDRIDVIKIDAEGADFEILLGAENIIRTWRPQLLLTTYHVAEHASQMRHWLESLNLGYEFVFRGIVTMGSCKARPVLMLASAK